MSRGDLVALAVRPIGKSRSRPPLALVIQRDDFAAHSSVTVLPVTRELRAAPVLRVLITADEGSALLTTSQVLIDQAQSVPRQRIRMVIGRLTAASLRDVDRALAIFLGIDSPITPG